MGGPVVGIVCLTAVVQLLGPVTGAKTSEKSDKRLRSVDLSASDRFGRSRLSKDTLCTSVSVLPSHTSNASSPGVILPKLIPL